MTPQELKNSILQLAIQGRLVEQRPEEGTAEGLYRQARAEKRRLIREGKIKKEKPVPELAEGEAPFQIPKSWKWVRLRAIVYNRKQVVPSDTFSYIDIGSIDNRRQRLNREETFISAGEAPSRARKLVERGDILYATVRPYLHNMCIIDRDFTYRPIASTGFAVMTCCEGIYNKYLFYYLLSPAFDRYVNARENAKGVAYPAISDDRLYRAAVALPPPAEQKRIVDRLEALLPWVDRYEQAWDRLEELNKKIPVELQKAVLQEAFQGKVAGQRPEEGTAEELYRQIQGEKKRLIREGKLKKRRALPKIGADEVPFAIPKSWKWVRLGDIVQFKPKNDLEDDTEVSFVPMALISDGFQNRHSWEIRRWKEVKRGFTHFSEGDIGIAKITPCFQNRKSVIFSGLLHGHGAGTTELSVVRVIGDLLSREYLLYFFKSAYFIGNGVKSFSGTAGQQRIHKDYLPMCPFPLPPLEEQRRIAARLKELLPLCEQLK